VVSLLEARNLLLKVDSKIVPSESLTFSVREGSIHAIVGQSGSGKTLLLKAIMGLCEYTGSLKLEGIEVKCAPREQILKKVFYIPENPEDLFVMNRVEHELAFILEESGEKPDVIESRVRGALELVGLEHAWGKSVFELSGGEKRRLAIAESLLVQAKLVLMDHPTADLDPPMKREFYSILELLRETGKTVVFTASRAGDAEHADSTTVLEAPRQAARFEPSILPLEEAMHEVLAVESLSFGYRRDRPVLLDVTFRAKSPGSLVILGRNGAGKTTLGKLIAGLLKPWKGSIILGGRTVGRRDVVYVYQLPQDGFVGQTLIEDLAMSLKVLGYDKKRALERAKELLKSYGLEEQAETPVFMLERGLSKLASILSSLLLRPRVIVLDEPTSGMDEDYERLVRSLIKAVSKRSLVITITHDINFAKSIGERALVLRDGRVAYDGSPLEVREEML